MALPMKIREGEMIWCGEHWINYQKIGEDDKITGMVSLYHTDYSPYGSGNTAYVICHDELDFEFICTDNRPLAGFIHDEMIKNKVLHFDKKFEIVDAGFKLEGDIVSSPRWQIDCGKHIITAVWNDPDPAIVAYRPQEITQNDYVFFSNLFFTDSAYIEVDGRRIKGKPYGRDIWIEVLGGGERSSCVFALGETMIRPQREG